MHPQANTGTRNHIVLLTASWRKQQPQQLKSATKACNKKLALSNHDHLTAGSIYIHIWVDNSFECSIWNVLKPTNMKSAYNQTMLFVKRSRDIVKTDKYEQPLAYRYPFDNTRFPIFIMVHKLADSEFPSNVLQQAWKNASSDCKLHVTCWSWWGLHKHQQLPRRALHRKLKQRMCEICI